MNNEQEQSMKSRGWLKNGNTPGDLSAVLRCGALNRRKTPCRAPAMKNGRCRLHGGLSTGAKTPEGIERIRRARTIHGRYSEASLGEARFVRTQFKSFKALLKAIKEGSFEVEKEEY